ncbi:MAG: site-specific integrase [Bdellovibrionaceae bacterium]|nr:site-specific integrase [Pseudobdellovibrionaceae bacterium]
MGKPASKDLYEHGIYRTDKNDIYDIRVQRTINGKQYHRRRSSINGIMTARKIRRQLEDELGKLELQIQGGDIPFLEAVEMYLTYLQNRINQNNGGSVSQKTFDDRRDSLRKYSQRFEKLNITEISISMIEAVVRGETHEDLKAISIGRRKKILSFFRQCFEYHLLEFGRIKINPATGIYFRNREEKKPIVIPKIEEVEKLLDYTKEEDPRWHAVYMGACHLGLRSGELYGLKWEDVNFETDSINVCRSYEFKTGLLKSPKNGTNRTVPLNETIKLFLQELKLKSTDLDGFVFERRSSWKKGEQKKDLNEFQKELGITITKFHALRGFFITNLLRSGCSAVFVRDMVGHQDIKTTMLYVAHASSELKGKTDALADIGRRSVASVSSLEEERKKREKKAE